MLLTVATLHVLLLRLDFIMVGRCCVEGWEGLPNMMVREWRDILFFLPSAYHLFPSETLSGMWILLKVYLCIRILSAVSEMSQHVNHTCSKNVTQKNLYWIYQIKVFRDGLILIFLILHCFRVYWWWYQGREKGAVVWGPATLVRALSPYSSLLARDLVFYVIR